MKTLILSVLALSFTNSAFASPSSFKGKCAKQALDAAVMKWADVPNPSEQLEYFPLSVAPVANGSDTYLVVLGISDGNEAVQAKYRVKFQDYAKCAKPEVTAE
jgi:hypothetical protein